MHNDQEDSLAPDGLRLNTKSNNKPEPENKLYKSAKTPLTPLTVEIKKSVATQVQPEDNLEGDKNHGFITIRSQVDLSNLDKNTYLKDKYLGDKSNKSNVINILSEVHFSNIDILFEKKQQEGASIANPKQNNNKYSGGLRMI